MKRTERRIRQREKILTIANKLFLKKGYVGTSLEDVAKASKINKSSFYNYFKKKSDLLNAFIAPILTLIDESSKGLSSNISPKEKLIRLILADVSMQASHPGVAQIGRFARVYLPPRQRQLYNDQTDRYKKLFKSVIKQGMDSGDFSKIDPELATLFVLGFLHSISIWYSPKGRVDHKEIGMQTVEFIVKALSTK